MFRPIRSPLTHTLFLASVLCLVRAGHATSPPIFRQSVPKMPLEKLNAAGETVEIQGRTYRLEPALWRDFMPVSPPDGKPLIALVHVIQAGSDAFTPSVVVHHLWVVNDQEIWSTSFSKEERSPAAPNQLEKIARDGPKWGPGISVDVVVGLLDELGKLYLLRAPGEPIRRTD